MTRTRARRPLRSIGIFVMAVILTLLLAGCGEEEGVSSTGIPGSVESTAPAGADATAPADSITTANETGPTLAETPGSGGVLRLITNGTAQVVGFWPKQGPADENALHPGLERIVTYVSGHKLEPCLAESAIEDPDALTVTVKLRQGVLFHDGSELTAEVAKWNYDTGMAGGKLQYVDAIKQFEIVDKYAYVIHLNYWHNQLFEAFLWVPMFSKEAYDKNGEEWTMTHLAGTGPFILEEFNRDQSIKWVRNPNYWRGDQYPYLDGVEYLAIVDATTASAMMEAGEGDAWQNADAQSQAHMEEKGLTVQTGSHRLEFQLMPNTMTESPMNDERVREAVEYALDKPAICEAIGYGRYVPIYRIMTPEDDQGVSLSKIKREHDPERARQLLVDAGYPGGCPIDLLAQAETGGRNTAAEAVKGYLDAAGFITNIDVADAGRFAGSVFGSGWEDLVLMYSGCGAGVTYLDDVMTWWGPEPKTRLASVKLPDDYLALFDPALKARNVEEQKARTADIVEYMAEHALTIPVYAFRTGLVVQDWVHTQYPMEAGVRGWSWYDDWMEPH